MGQNKIMNGKLKGCLAFFVLFLVFFTIDSANAASVSKPCNLDAFLINQDPYPAIAGGYVEVLFQISGVNDNCEGGAAVELILDYPLYLDKGDTIRTIKSGTYAGYGYNSNWNILYKIRINENALEGDYEVELRLREGNYLGAGYGLKRFNITIEDGRTDFEVHIKNHKLKNRNLIFEILNVGNQDIEALTLEIPKQDNIIVKGSNRNIVGDLDSNEYTTADFEAIPSDGEILVNFYYTDVTGERRLIQKMINYDSSYFIDSLENQAPDMTSTYVIIGVIVLLIAFFIFRRHRNKKRNKGKMNFSV